MARGIKPAASVHLLQILCSKNKNRVRDFSDLNLTVLHVRESNGPQQRPLQPSPNRPRRNGMPTYPPTCHIPGPCSNQSITTSLISEAAFKIHGYDRLYPEMCVCRWQCRCAQTHYPCEEIEDPARPDAVLERRGNDAALPMLSPKGPGKLPGGGRPMRGEFLQTSG